MASVPERADTGKQGRLGYRATSDFPLLDKVAAPLRLLQMPCGGKEPAQLARPYLCFLEAEWEFSNAEV